jgi:hypothetical protein
VVKPVLRIQIDLSECFARHRFAGFTTFTGFLGGWGARLLELNEDLFKHAPKSKKRSRSSFQF